MSEEFEDSAAQIDGEHFIILCITISIYICERFLMQNICLFIYLDSITALEYNADGEYLATGDRIGRITILKLENENKIPRQVRICP
jgi:hypothetical protein